MGCHNSHPQSPKKDCKPGDVRGAISVTVPVDVVGAQIEGGMRQLGLAALPNGWLRSLERARS